MPDQVIINITDTVPPENFATVDTATETGTVYRKDQDNAWRESVEANAVSGIKGVAQPNDTVPQTGFFRMLAESAITYTNYLDFDGDPIVVTPQDLNVVNGVQRNEVIIEVSSGVAEKKIFAKVGADGANGTASIPKWVAQDYIADAMVLKDLVQYTAPTGANSTDVPGVSTKWTAISGKVKWLTQAEFDALSPQEQNNGTAYHIEGEESLEAELINFSENIYYNKQAVSVTTVDGPIYFKPFGTNAKLMGSTLVRLTADGVNIPDFSKFKKLNGSQNYDNTAGVLNSIFFFYDGFDAWVNIWQGIGNSDIDYSDLTPPTPPVVQVTETQDYFIKLAWSGASDNVAVVSYEIYVNNILKNTVSASPYTVTGLNSATLYQFKIKAIDAAGNKSVFSNNVSSTTLVPQDTPVVFNSLSNGANYNNGVLTGAINTGGIVTPYINTLNGFELILGESSELAVLMITAANNGSYEYASNVNTMIFAIFKTAGTIQLTKTGGSLLHTHTGSENFARIKRVGNNAVMSVSSNGVNWNDVFTVNDGFIGYDTAFVKGLFAASNGSLKAYTKN